QPAENRQLAQAPQPVRVGEVQITVQSALNQTPLSGARVTLTNTVDASIHRSLVSDAKGVADFRDLPPGDYVVEIFDLNHDPDKTQLRVPAGIRTSYVSYLDIK
ncbi:unnamed protein product, partial [Phaeothamnion confervicola]